MTEIPITRQVFIGGCSRSGTTLLGSMLGAHSDAVSTPESHFKRTELNKLGGDPHTIDVNAAFDNITKHWRFAVWGIDVQATPRDPLTDYGDVLNYLVWQYARHVEKPNAHIWVDHTPENISYAHTLLKIFPEAKFLHIVRDGRGVAASIMPLDWGPNTIERAARWWVELTSYGLALEHTLPADRVIRVHYEDLVMEPVEQLQRLSTFLGMEYQPAMAEAAGFKVPSYTAEQHQLVGKKPDASRAASWKKKLTPREIEIFEHITRDYLKYLGYEMEYGFSAQGISPSEKASLTVREVWRDLFANRVRWLRRGSRLVLRREG